MKSLGIARGFFLDAAAREQKAALFGGLFYFNQAVRQTWSDNAYIALAALRDATIYPNINRADYALTIYPLPRMTKSLLL